MLLMSSRNIWGPGRASPVGWSIDPQSFSHWPFRLKFRGRPGYWGQYLSATRSMLAVGGVTIPGKVSMTYLMQRVPHVLEYAHIQHLQAHLQACVVVLGTSRCVDGTAQQPQLLHGGDNTAKVLLIVSLRTETEGDWFPCIATSIFQ